MGGTGCLTGARTECRTAKRWACGIGRIYSISRLGPLFPLVMDSGLQWPLVACRCGSPWDRLGTVYAFPGTVQGPRRDRLRFLRDR